MACAAAVAPLLLLLAVAAPTVPALGAAPELPVQQRYPPTTHTCSPPAAPGLSGAAAAVRTCTFRNLYLWGGRAYYLSDGPAPDLSSLGLYMHIWVGPQHREQQPWFLTAGYSPALFASLLARGTAVPALVRMPLAYLWHGYEVFTDVASGAACDGRSLTPGMSNYYHWVGEYLPLLSATLCEEFGHCQPFGNRSALQIIDVSPPGAHPCNVQELYPSYYREGLACLSDRPLRHLAGSYLASRLVRVETAWVGLGPRCRGMQPFDCYTPGGSRLRISGAQMAAWRATAEQCFGFPCNAAAQLRPVRLLVVDRLYESGRSILNIASVVRALRRRFSPHQVEMRLEYMEGLTIRQQAEIFAWASVVVHMHGAAIGNYGFLPKGAVAVHLSPFPARWPPTLVLQWAQDLRQVTDIEVRHYVNQDWSRVQVVPDIAAQQAARRGGVAKLIRNQTFYAAYRGTFECPEWLGSLLQPCRQFMSRSLTASLPPDVIADLAAAAVVRLFEKQGELWEPQQAPAEEAGQAGEMLRGAVPTAGGTAGAAGRQMADTRGDLFQALTGSAAAGAAGTAGDTAAMWQHAAGRVAGAGSGHARHKAVEALRRPLVLPSGNVSLLLVALGGAMLATWLLLRGPPLKVDGLERMPP